MVKGSIRRKVLFILLAGIIVTLLSVGVVSIYGQNRTQRALDEKSEAIRNFLAESIGSFTETFAKERLREVTATKAQHLDRELYIVQEDVEYMAEAMQQLLTSPDKHLPRTLPDTRREADILTGTSYIHYSVALLQQGISPEVQDEIGMAGNFADVLKPMSTSYAGSRTSMYAGSRHGYLICLDLLPKEEGRTSIFPSAAIKADFLDHYDPRERTWYKQAEAAGKPVFSSVYKGAEGNLDLTCAAPYYDARGFAGVVGISYTVDDIYQVLVADAMSHEGHSFVLDQAGRVIFSSEKEGILAAADEGQDIRQADASGMAEAARRMTAGETDVMSVEISGKAYYLAFAPLKITGWSLGVLVDTAEIMAPVKQVEGEVVTQLDSFEETVQEIMRSILWQSALLLLPIILLLMYVSNLLAGRFTRPVRKLAEGAREIAAGNFDKKVELTTGDELEELADSFNFMTDELKKYTENLAKVAAEEERSRTELEVAARIQMDMLPTNFADFTSHPEFELYALMEPAKDVGGDFYDFYLLQGRYLVVTVADVSGKGVPAALFMAKSQSVLKNCVLRSADPEDMAGVLEAANEELCRNNEAAMFVTAFIGVLDLQTGRFTYADGGHCPPLLGRGGQYGFLPLKKSCVLGLMEMPYEQQCIDLKPQDTLFIYTDGVSEAMNEEYALFTEARIKDGLNGLAAGQSVADLLRQMLAVVRQYAGNAEQSDDITMLGLRYKGK